MKKKRIPDYYRSRRYAATTKERYSRPRKVIPRKQKMLCLDDEEINNRGVKQMVARL
jgi:hypothetical protein